MGAMERVTVTMPAAMADSLRRSVADGEYGSTDEIVREAVRDWALARAAGRDDPAALREAIRAGMESGPGRPADEMFAELRARYAGEV